MHQVHSRYAIWHKGQHPYQHTLNEFAYGNSSLPGVTNVESAMNWILAVLYPQTKPAVANVAALPLVGNSLNDYRVVQDDGDGKAASYRWEQREGEATPTWHKIYDMDWGSDSILAEFYNQTQALFVLRQGRTDTNPDGTPVVGFFAGQLISGGNLTGQNLTLDANSVDGTGFVQTKNTFRPTTNNTLDLGTLTEKFRSGIFGTSVLVDTLSLSTGLITDTSGTISFAADNLVTTGNISGAIVTGSTSLKTGTMTITGGNIADTSGALSFNALNLTTTGSITAGQNSKLADFTFNDGSLTSASAAINFGTNNLITTGTLAAGNTTVTQLDSGNIRLAGNTISILNTNGNLILQSNGTGVIDLQNSVTSLGITANGVVTVTGQLNVDNLRLDGGAITSTNLNGNITLSPNGTGWTELTSVLQPTSDNVLDLGTNVLRFRTLYVGTSISDGTTSITQATLQSLRDINAGVTVGMSLFWTGTKWEASLPDSEIDHSTLSGLTTGDAGHTQFVMLAGRAGGQTIQGGTAASENLVLESTSNATKGTVQTKNHFVPFTAATYSGSWLGTDLGSSTKPFRDLFTRGELKGARVENFTFATLPASSAQNIGRMVYAADQAKLYIDTGAALKVAGVAKFIADQAFDGTQLTKTVTVSSDITDARNAVWELADNANDFEKIHCVIKKISATQVQIITHGALPAGSYRLIGLE